MKVPFLVLHGDEDKLCNIEGSKALYEKAPVKVPNGHSSVDRQAHTFRWRFLNALFMQRSIWNGSQHHASSLIHKIYIPTDTDIILSCMSFVIFITIAFKTNNVIKRLNRFWVYTIACFFLQSFEMENKCLINR